MDCVERCVDDGRGRSVTLDAVAGLNVCFHRFLALLCSASSRGLGGRWRGWGCRVGVGRLGRAGSGESRRLGWAGVVARGRFGGAERGSTGHVARGRAGVAWCVASVRSVQAKNGSSLWIGWGWRERGSAWLVTSVWKWPGSDRRFGMKRFGQAWLVAWVGLDASGPGSACRFGLAGHVSSRRFGRVQARHGSSLRVGVSRHGQSLRSDESRHGLSLWQGSSCVSWEGSACRFGSARAGPDQGGQACHSGEIFSNSTTSNFPPPWLRSAPAPFSWASARICVSSFSPMWRVSCAAVFRHQT